MGALVKNLSIKELGYGNDEFKKLNDACISKYRELIGLESEEI